MEKLKTVINKYWKVYVVALILATVCDLIGTLKFNIGIGTLTLFPMVFATIFGGRTPLSFSKQKNQSLEEALF